MKNESKKLLILERCQSDLEFSKSGSSYVLEGIFTEFGIKNRNNRIYNADDVLPHINSLQEKIKSHTLLGELDHPNSFEVSLLNASHVIESLDYDESGNCIRGKIRLLDTPKGQIAKALIEGGVPLHISSRAAGTVGSNGNVTMQQLFTYDLVADPGFANAKLTRVNESYGWLNENEDVAIYDLSAEAPAEAPAEECADCTCPNCEYVSLEDFQKYSDYLSDIITNLKSAVSNYKEEIDKIKGIEKEVVAVDYNDGVDNSTIENMLKAEVDNKMGEVKEELNVIKQYQEYLAEQLDRSIQHSDYLAENLDNTIMYQNYLAEHLDATISHSDYLAEELEKSNAYQDYLAENLDNAIQHNDYLAENLDNAIKHSDYLAENLDNAIQHNDYLAENLDNAIKYQDYIAENLDAAISHSDYLAEELDHAIEDAVRLNEAVASTEAEVSALNETNSYKEELSSKLNTIMESFKQEQEVKAEEAKAEEARMINEAKVAADTTIVSMMPDYLAEAWNKLSDTRKEAILNEAEMYILNTPYRVEQFWKTRDLREKQSTVLLKEVREYNAPTERSQSQIDLMESVKRRLRGF